MSRRKSFDIETSQAIGRRIKEIRGTAKQADFASNLGVDRATLANYESGRRIPNDTVLKKLSSISGKTVPEIVFGAHKTPFAEYMTRINEEIFRQSQANPGFVPKWTISDDEIAIIMCIRLAASGDLSIFPMLEPIVKQAEQVVQSDIRLGLPGYGEAHVERLKSIIEKRSMQEGFDPDRALFLTFCEELWAREGASQGQEPD
jgi:transcriptional regulator with XRE-family HTH domain